MPEGIPTEKEGSNNRKPLGRVVVIGAGPAGLSCAMELSRQGIETMVLEQDPKMVGGISRTAEYRGYRFDLGGHRFFSKNAEIESFWDEILPADMLTRPRKSRIFYQGKFFDYPLRPVNAFFNLGVTQSIAAVVSYAKSRLFPKPQERTFEDWVINRFGRKLYLAFFKTYTEKVWGLDCRTISADWAAQRIKGLSLSSAVIHAFRRNRPPAGRDSIKTLIHSFRYPRKGPGMMWEAVAKRIEQGSGNIIMGEKVTGIVACGGRVTEVRTQNGRSFRGEWFVSSMPLRSLIRAFGSSVPPEVLHAANSLRYRDFLTVALIVDQPRLFPDNWVYIHDPTVRVGRIQNFGNWSPEMLPGLDHSCLGLEYFCNQNDDLWIMADDALITIAEQEIRSIGLLPSGCRVLDGTVVRVPKAYPVYDDDYQRNVQRIRHFLEHSAWNLQVIGRNGMHRYNNQDHAMMTGILAARNLLGSRYDLWTVNSDAEYLEEGAVSPSQETILLGG